MTFGYCRLSLARASGCHTLTLCHASYFGSTGVVGGGNSAMVGVLLAGSGGGGATGPLGATGATLTVSGGGMKSRSSSM